MGSIDVLLNTAGVLDAYKTLEELTLQNGNEFINESQFDVFDDFSILAKNEAQKSGVIINMASVAGLIAGGGGVAYTTSKHAIVGLTKQLALDEAQHGIQVAAIAPGASIHR